MKKSKFNIIVENNDNTKIIFNSISCALAEIDDEFIEVLENIENINYDEVNSERKELLDNMLLGNFIVNDEIDEMKVVKYRHLKSKFNDDTLGLVIAPTLVCNFDCPYCYEENKCGFMNSEVKENIIKFIEIAANKKKDIFITWYGGEPLVAKDIIYELSEKAIKICEKNEVNYNSFIVTNGYLINQETIDKLKQYKVTGAQITVDGPPDIHNSRRRLKGSSEETFDVILNNIKLLRKNDVGVSIRINTDRSNENRIEELLDIFAENKLTDVVFSLGHVIEYTNACMSVSESCLKVEEYSKVTLEFYKLLHKKSLLRNKLELYPSMKGTYCCADSSDTYVVDPEGYLYKCWNDVGVKEKSVGNVNGLYNNPSEKMLMRSIDYLLWSPFNHSECEKCSVLPVCMGGCPYNGEKNNQTPQCEQWKYNIEDVVNFVYEMRKGQ